MNGWVCTHRKIIDWQWYKDGNTYRLFTHLILLANYEDKNWQGQIIKRGQLVTSLASLADDLGLSIKQIRTSLAKLESTNEIKRETSKDRKFTIISIVNYSKYQDKNSENNEEGRAHIWAHIWAHQNKEKRAHLTKPKSVDVGNVQKMISKKGAHQKMAERAHIWAHKRATTKQYNNNNNNIYLYFINKYKSDEKIFSEQIKIISKMKQDPQWDRLTSNQQLDLQSEIFIK